MRPNDLGDAIKTIAWTKDSMDPDSVVQQCLFVRIQLFLCDPCGQVASAIRATTDQQNTSAMWSKPDGLRRKRTEKSLDRLLVARTVHAISSIVRLWLRISGDRNPTLGTVLRVIGALGLKLRAEAVPDSAEAGQGLA